MARDSVVVPGERVGVVEEFGPGEGTYEDNGSVYSKLFGHLTVDLGARVATVGLPQGRSANVPSVRDVVLAQIVDERKDVALTEVLCIEGRKMFGVPYTAQLHVSRVSRGYFSTIEDAMRIGDLLRASIASVEPHLRLSISTRELGVIAAFCSRCGDMLLLEGSRLICPSCENVERRKISSRYVNVTQPAPRAGKLQTHG